MNAVARFIAAFLLGALCVQTPAHAAKEDDKKESGGGTGLITQTTYRYLQNIQELMGEEKYEEALEDLRKLKERTKNEYETAVVFRTIAFVHIYREEYREAIPPLEKALEMGAFNEDQLKSALYNLGQLYATIGDYENVISTLERYFDKVEEPQPKAYILMAQAHVELENYRKAVPYGEKGIELAEEPVENYYNLLLAAYNELNMLQKMSGLLEEMVTYWPDKMRYWWQLFGVYMELERDGDATAVLASAYHKGLFKEESHYKNLTRMYLLQQAPFRGAKVLIDGLEKGVVEKTKDNYRLLATAWTQAKEWDEALGAFEQAAKLDEDGELFLRMAQIQQMRANWAGVKESADNALQKGGLDEEDIGKAYLLRGQYHAENKQYDQALEAFRQARRYEDTQERARQWIRYIREESQL